tara:strand:+ start:1104 stop:1550 length:447 start_codon:yes stop_codon:yes gene_type:complete
MNRSATTSLFSRRSKLAWILLGVLPAVPAFAEDNIHEEVAAALEWRLPANECSKPNNFEHPSNLVDGEVGSYPVERHKLKVRRWQECLETYRERLMRDFELLKGSVRHGLTHQQANQILTKMALIQEVYLSPDGLPDGAVQEEDQNTW